MDNYQITFQTWDKLAGAYKDKFMDMDLYDDTYDRFCQLVTTKGARIFEIGCGPGNITKYLLNKRPDFFIEAIDTAPGMVKLAKELNPSAEFSVMDCRAIDTMTKKYDAIVCGFCMPYLSKEDVVKLFRDCAVLLESEGIFYFSAIEDAYAKSGYEVSSNGEYKMYVYYHEAEYLEAYLTQSGFGPVEWMRKNYSKADDTVSVHLIGITKKI